MDLAAKTIEINRLKEREYDDVRVARGLQRRRGGVVLAHAAGEAGEVVQVEDVQASAEDGCGPGRSGALKRSCRSGPVMAAT